MVSEREMKLRRSSKRQCIELVLPRPHSSPFTRAIIVRLYGSISSSAVVIHGPIALPVSKSFPFAGPSWPDISSHLLVARAEIVEDRIAKDVLRGIVFSDVGPAAFGKETELEFEVAQFGIAPAR